MAVRVLFTVGGVSAAFRRGTASMVGKAEFATSAVSHFIKTRKSFCMSFPQNALLELVLGHV
jgi:hypothetical protein